MEREKKYHLPKEERRRQLLDAAIKTFGRRGYHNTQVSDIIETAGVARGTFYLYFRSKREIFDHLMDELFNRVRSEVRGIPKEAIDKIPNQLGGNIERITNLLFENPLLAKLLFNESVGLDADLDRRLRKFYGQLLDLIRRGLKQGQEMGFVRDGDHHIMAISLLGTVKEIFYQHLLKTDLVDRKLIKGEIFRLVIFGIIHPAFRPNLEKVLLN